ncbi:MAG: hypothetical protein FVQ84_18915 [Planctomycetes bacterium]|nr:hypothetical protein [Planctomycetota bacterium]
MKTKNDFCEPVSDPSSAIKNGQLAEAVYFMLKKTGMKERLEKLAARYGVNDDLTSANLKRMIDIIINSNNQKR